MGTPRGANMSGSLCSKTQDLHQPFPGRGGRKMMNLFDLSAGMAGTKLLTDRSHRDGSPVQRNRPDVNRTTDPAGVNMDDKLAASERRSNSSKKADGMPMKALIAKEMSKEAEPKRKPPGVVARLMGLEDDLPSPQPVVSSGRSSSKEGCSRMNSARSNQDQRRKEHHVDKTKPREIHPPSEETVKYKDVYEVRQQPPRTNHCQDQQKGRLLQSKNDRGMDLIRQKFMEAKHLVTDEKLLHSREFQDALEVLSSNKDLFLEFLEEPNSIFSTQISEPHPITSPSQTKCITVLKPLRSVKTRGGNKSRLQRVNESRWEMNKPHLRRGLPHLKAERFSQPTRIVVLKPSPGNPHCIKAKASPLAISSEPIDRNDCCGGREIAKETCHRRDESLLSSVYSNGYGGDESSFNRSEHKYIEEEVGNFSDLEILSPTSRHSWDYINRIGSPISDSSFSRASYSPEPSVIREAKKRLSERWAFVASIEDNQELQVPRNSSTLGEMLAMCEVKKEEVGDRGLTVYSSRSCGMEDESSRQSACLSRIGEKECSPRDLLRSKSVPASSSVYENIGSDLQSASSQDSKPITAPEITKPKGKSSFKGKVSSFFFSRSKKLGKEKLACSSVGSGDKVQTPSAEFSRNTLVSKFDYSSNPDGGSEENFKENLEISASLVSVSALKTGFVSSEVTLSLERPTSSDCWSENPDKIRPSESPRTTRDQPSPTSVLDAPFEDVNNSDPQSSRNQQPLPRCSTIESVARFLSWEEVHLEAPSLNEELDHYFFVQKLLSSSGLDNEKHATVFAEWHSLEFPLNPMLLDKFLDRKEEAAKCRERRSNQRLLFDCVNAALLEIGQATLQSAYPWPKVHTSVKNDPPPRALLADVWSLMRGWFSGDNRKLVEVEKDNVSLVVERVVTKEVQGTGWVESMRLEVDEMSKQISEQVLGELVGDALAYFPIACL